MDLKKYQGSPKIILSKNILNQINTCHSIVGKEEWSGILLYKIKEGKLNNPDDLVIYCIGFYPMNVGNTGYTEFHSDVESIIDMSNKFPEYEQGDLSTGLIHSHHNMSAFFSGTDDEELQENAELYNAYLSLIVNFSMQPVAKLAFKINRKYEVVSTYKDMNGSEKSSIQNSEDSIIAYCDCNIEFDIESNWTSEKITELKNKKPITGFDIAYYNNGYGGDYESYGYQNQQFDKTPSKEKNEVLKQVDLRNFICKCISINHKYIGSDLSACIQRMNAQITKNNNKYHNFKKASRDYYKKAIEGVVDDAMKLTFGEKVSLDEQLDIIADSKDLLKPYQHYLIASVLSDYFDEILKTDIIGV